MICIGVIILLLIVSISSIQYWGSNNIQLTENGIALAESDKSNKSTKHDNDRSTKHDNDKSNTSDTSGKSNTSGKESGITKISAPHLNYRTLDRWTLHFKAAKIIDGKKVPIKELTDLPPIITVGKNNIDAINDAIKNQTSIVLDVNFQQLQDGSAVIDTFDMPTYDVPSSPDVISILPSIVTTVNPVTGQTVATSPLDKIVPGQEIILPVDQSVLASYGGLSQLDVEAAENAVSIGTAPREWFVISSNKDIPSPLPTLSRSGIQNRPVLFIDVSYPFEEKGIGFDWTNHNTLAKPATLQVMVDKQGAYTEQTDSAGCPVVDVFSLDETRNPPAWTTNGVSVLSIKSISSTQCLVEVESEHLSKFAVGGIRPMLLGGLSVYTSSSNPPPKVSTQKYNGIRFDVNYIMDGSISAMQVDEHAKSVTFDLMAVNGGKMLISLPHDLVSAQSDQYVLLVDGHETNYEVQDSTSQYVILKASLPQGATRLTVMGTSVIPEFGVIVMMVLALSIIGIVVITRHRRNRIMAQTYQ